MELETGLETGSFHILRVYGITLLQLHIVPGVGVGSVSIRCDRA